MFKFLPTGRFRWIDPKEFDMNNYNCNSTTGCVLQFVLEYPKELRELYYDYPLAPDKIEIKKEMLYQYRSIISDLCMYFTMGTCNFT